MKFKKQMITSALIVSMLTSALPSIAAPSSTTAEIIYENTTSQNLSSGIKYSNIRRFLTSGWMNINIVTVDLTNPYVKLDLLTSSEGVGTLDNVQNMASAAGAVAAINADFFNKYTKTDGTGGGYPMGFALKSGEYVSTPYYENALGNKFASFAIDNLKQYFFGYVTQKTSITSPNGSKINISDINKYSSSYNIPVLYNKYWGKYSIGASSKFPDMVEMVVSDSVVTEIRSNMPPVEIPENGYVVSARKDGAVSLLANFLVGDFVQLNIQTTPDLSDKDFAISGSTLLVKDGKIAPFTHTISGLHPRSAIGVSADGRYMYIVAVDGRQTVSQGMTQEELAQLMLDIGAYNALNFDGGGSTELIGRKLGDSALSLLNSPSEIPLRKVANALGVFSTAPEGTLNSLVIETEDQNVFVNTSRKFSVKGYDEHFNPIEIDEDDVKWRISGVNGTFKNNVLTAQEVGEGTVIATLDGVSAKLPVSILSAPVELTMSPRLSKTTVGSTVNFSVKGKNKFGYSAKIQPSDLQWSLDKAVGTLSDGIFTANSQGNAIVSCSYGKASAFSGISVTGQQDSVIDVCDTQTAEFKSYPKEITGSVTVETDEKHSGRGAYKLAYDFSSVTDRSKAAYAVFPDKSIVLGENVTDIGLWVYNSAPKTDWLKAQITDSTGGTHLIDLSRDLSWTGWKFIQVPLADTISRPAQISRIYVVQIDPTIPSIGEIRFDDITVTSRKSDELKASDIPENIKLPDSANIEVKSTSSSDSFSFAIVGRVTAEKTLLDKLFVNKITNIMNSTELSVMVGQSTNDFYKTLKKPVFTAMGGNTTKTFKNSTFIILDDLVDGIRKTNPAQWKWFENELSNVKTENLFILMPRDINTFSDQYEAKLFQDILTEYKKKSQKNVWLITGNSANSTGMERGIRIVTATGLSPSTTDVSSAVEKTQYMLVTVRGKEITYQIKNLF